MYARQPLLTPPVVRQLAGWPQVRVAGMAGVSVGSVRLYEIEPDAIQSEGTRRALDAVYRKMRDILLARPQRG